MQTYFFTFIYLLIIPLVVGSIYSNEYSSTMKELVIAVHNRASIYFAKVLIITGNMLLIFLIYGFIILITNDSFNWHLLLNQFIAVIQHTYMLIFIGIIIKSFSSLIVFSAVMIFVYRELAIRTWQEEVNVLINATFYRQFTSFRSNNFEYLLAVAMMIVFLGLGLIIYRNQEIN